MKEDHANPNKPPKPERRPWMKSFGKLRHLGKEHERLRRILEEEFEQIEPEDRD
jgi:hypothetical protein